MRTFFTLASSLFYSAFLLCAAEPEPEFRTWTDASGKHTVVAKFVELRGTLGIFERKNGERFEVPLSNLSAGDVAVISESGKPLIEGIWGGKWDNQWPVFLVVEKKADGTYDVGYNWYENLSKPMSSRTQPGETEGEHIKSGSLIFRHMGDHVLLYGSFRRPRAARMVKLDVEKDDLAEVNLQDHGWKAGTPPAEEAKKTIVGE